MVPPRPAVPSVPRGPRRPGPRVAAVAGAVLALAGALRPARADDALLPSGTPAVTADEFRARVRWLADPARAGRMSVEPGAFAASEAVAATFARLGLEPAGTEGFFQPFRIDLPRLAAGNRLEATAGGARRGFDVERDWNPMAMSPTTSARGDLVFAGFGIVDPARGRDDYAGLDVRDRVVLVLRREPPREGGFTEHATFRAKVGRAHERGAAAVLVVNDRGSAPPPADPLFPWAEAAGVTPGSALLPVAFVTRATAGALLAPLRRSLDDLEAAARAPAGGASCRVPGVEVSLATAFERPRGPNARNVAALLPGSDPALLHEVVVVGAHHDHVGLGMFGSAGGPAATGRVHPGADDNASGTAALVEIAEALAGAARRPRRSVLFLSFSGEELGLLGSVHWVEHPTVPLARVVTMVNLDMVGRYDPARRLEVGGVGTGEGLQALVAAANAPYGLELAWDPQGVAPSDSTSFFRKGLPVLFFFTGIHADYHTPRDTWETVNAEGGAKVASLAHDVVRTLADRDARVVFTRPPAPARGRAALGIGPAPGSDSDGVLVASVVDDGAAAAAGIRPGDVVTALGASLVKDLRDLARALAAQKPGDVVLVKVLRGGEEHTLRVTLGAR